ncbi:sigma-70 family RNA polymerase sigma factor [Vreelandella alkaliphila]|uniref:Sigma-70 family RNA polymerase sigma factor n=1 Tax=Vreelandella alkaliphila TaxID=272774 RepID=A0AAJ2RZA5_9GAMM|nr:MULTISPECIES: sigma-70 family RNA polymerase sigma factor [Halomonas]MDX5979279.1 sigma-70 family RNA polymerase sigma factor [Halomonas alkaliphila]UTD54362.1 sigma-70 family RNA polymerase sigma factor [Halomonas sp. MS1]
MSDIGVSTIANDFDYADALARCARGEQAALHQLYRQEGARLLGVVMRIVKDRGMAEDIVHDACLNIWQRADSFDPERGSARTWIFSIARHLALNAIRQRDREIRVDINDPGELADDDTYQQSLSTTAEAFDWQTGQQMDECLQQLETERRNCVLHAYVDGLSHAEISAHTGAPLGTVKAWIKRSLLRLRECMS